MRHLALAATALTALASTALAVDVKLYGVVDKALMVHDDGETTESSIVDNNNESTRFGLAGEHKLDNGLTAGVLFEVEQASNRSNAITQAGTGINHSQANTPTNTTSDLTERMARVSLGGDFGTILLGQQDLATDDAAYHDLAAAGSVMNPNVAAFGGGLKFRTKSGATFGDLTAPGYTTVTVSDMALGMDGGADVDDSIRYNSPIFYGFNGSLSVAQGGTVDATARYAGSLAGLQVDSAVGYKWVNDNTTTATDEDVGALYASASVKHSSGLAATVAYQGRQLEHKTAGVEEGQGWYGKVGYEFGPYGIAADYAHFSNPLVTATDNSLDAYGLGAAYDLGHGVSTGILYRNYNAKVSGVTTDKQINVGVASLKVKF